MSGFHFASALRGQRVGIGYSKAVSEYNVCLENDRVKFIAHKGEPGLTESNALNRTIVLIEGFNTRKIGAKTSDFLFCSKVYH